MYIIVKLVCYQVQMCTSQIVYLTAYCNSNKGVIFRKHCSVLLPAEIWPLTLAWTVYSFNKHLQIFSISQTP